jgi:hypothetical protein
MVEAIDAFGLEEWVRFWFRTRKIANIATSVLPWGENSSAKVKIED